MQEHTYVPDDYQPDESIVDAIQRATRHWVHQDVALERVDHHDRAGVRLVFDEMIATGLIDIDEDEFVRMSAVKVEPLQMEEEIEIQVDAFFADGS